MTIIDKAVIQAAAGSTSLTQAIIGGTVDAMRRPVRSLLATPAYRMVAGVYAATYATANIIDSICERRQTSPALHSAAKLGGTTVANSASCIAKDVALARAYGAPSAGRMPALSIGLFGLRDMVCVGSAFTVPELAASFLTSAGVEKRRAEDAAQLISPVAMQAFVAPLHLLGLNLYNMPVATVRQRIAAVAATAPQTTVAFAARMAPAFGIGGVLNASLTARAKEALRARSAQRERLPLPAPGPAQLTRRAGSFVSA